METMRQDFYPLDQILQEVEIKIQASEKAGQKIDYLTLVPDGEPTLDKNLGNLIQSLQAYSIPVAVISNASLIDISKVRDDLTMADWVSLKIDAVIEEEWRRVNRPHRLLSLPSILAGMQSFRNRFQGEFVTETMLISNVNDSVSAMQGLSDFLLELKPDKSYLSIPIRPPAETWVKSPDIDSLERILAFVNENLPFMEVIFESEKADFVSTGDLGEDILSITAVHPIREKALALMVHQAGGNWHVIEGLIASGKITCIQYRDEKFYLRRFPAH
jgi:wyosine [tRNA(Phe)-imidazoG37] synthetase (radical SAM superfamily)